jgi:hypothetical protein
VYKCEIDDVGYGIMKYPDLPTNKQNRLLIFSHFPNSQKGAIFAPSPEHETVYHIKIVPIVDAKSCVSTTTTLFHFNVVSGG